MNIPSSQRLDSVENATNFLLIDWPSNSTVSLHHAAQVAAIGALNGHIPVAEFRAAFMAAAKEAGILAETDDLWPSGLPTQER